MIATAAALAQGQLNFSNIVPAAGINAPILLPDGSAAGSGYFAQLYWGTADDPSSFDPVGDAVELTAGYILPRAVTLPGAPDGTSVFVQVRAWEGAAGTSYEAARANLGLVGESNVLNLTVAEAPNLPPDMVGLESFSLTVIPEPSTIALGLLGAAALLLRRRK